MVLVLLILVKRPFLYFHLVLKKVAELTILIEALRLVTATMVKTGRLLRKTATYLREAYWEPNLATINLMRLGAH